MLNTLHIQDISGQDKSTTQRHLLTPNKGSASCSRFIFSMLIYPVTMKRPSLPNVLAVLIKNTWYISTQHFKIKPRQLVPTSLATFQP